MKKIIQILILLVSFGAISQVESKPMDFMVITSKINQLEPILLAANDIATKGDFKIVLYGKNVSELLNPETEKFIRWAKKSNVKISVCQMSLDVLKINPKTIPEEIEVVNNAFLYALQLQKAGYKILSL